MNHGVSVVVISRNEEKNIGDCLGSLVGLDYPDYEIIVIDSSSDRTPEIVKRYSGVKLYRVQKEGFAAARNMGIEKATKGMIAFTDADCIVPPDWLSTLAPYVIEGASAAGGAAVPPPGAGYMGRCIACLGFPAGGAIGTQIMKDISTCNAIFSRKDVLKVGSFDEKLAFGTEDSDLSRRLQRAGYDVRIVPESYVFHKTRKLRDFPGWCYRRGNGKFNLSRNPSALLLPLTIFVFPLSRKYRLLVRKRRKLMIGTFSLLFVIPALFLCRQAMISLGWLGGLKGSIGRKKKHQKV